MTKQTGCRISRFREDAKVSVHLGKSDSLLTFKWELIEKKAAWGVCETNPKPPRTNMKTDTFLIPLTQGKFAIVSPEDYEWLSQWKWHASKGVFASGERWYAQRIGPRPDRKHFSMHREIGIRKGLPEYPEYDHKNRDGLDNRRENIRGCTRSQNLANRRKRLNTSSRYKGVIWSKEKRKWRAEIRVDKKTNYIGYFTDEKAAADAYAEAATIRYGEFAHFA